ncbi:MAG: vitamin K epoxide reductase family protein [Cytophagales bacterium]|nr:vitamin K epoxide reductase family protein [Cytophagales bacterium]
MNKSDEPIYTALKNYLTREGYRLDPQDLKLQLGANPDYPSIKAITDTLDYFGVENLAVQVPITSLPELPDYFLSTVEDDEGLRTVEVLKKGQDIILKDQGSKKRMSSEQFKVIWSGTVMAIEPKHDKSTRIDQNRIIPIMMIIATFLIFGYLSLEVWHQWTLVLISAAGGWLSYLAIREDLGMYNKATAKICNSDDLKTNCGEVIHSDASKLFGIKLTDASLSFFLSILLIINTLGTKSMFFAALACLSIPVVLYSLYVQAFVQRIWCPLCLGISTSMILMAIYTVVTFDGQINTMTGLYAVKASAIFGLIYVLWLEVRKVMEDTIDHDKVKMEYARFKRNPMFFNHALAASPFPNIIELQPSEEIWFGNPDARIVITGVTNPFCGYCKDSFKVYDQLLDRFPDQIKLRIVFYISSVMTEPNKYVMPGRVVELFQESPEQAYQALKEWYEGRDIAQWKNTYGIPKDPNGHELLNRHLNWSRGNGVAYTPMTILGNYFFPEEYEITDFPALLPDMIGQLQAVGEPAYQ